MGKMVQAVLKIIYGRQVYIINLSKIRKISKHLGRY